MDLIWTILIGFMVGVIAKFLTHGLGPQGFFLTAALGIVGSIVATYLGRALVWYAAGHSAGFVGALIGALIVVFVYHLVIRNRGATVR